MNVQKVSESHCVDCCCARAWKVLGISEYTGKSIPEHIEELTSALRGVIDVLTQPVQFTNTGDGVANILRADAAAAVARVRQVLR